MTLNFPTIPNTFTANTKAKSAEVNANFSAILTALTAGTKDAYFGALALAQATKTNTDYTILDTDSVSTFLFSAGSSTRTATLPTLADNQGRFITIFKIDSGSGVVTIDGEGAETINGATTATLTSQYDGMTLFAGVTEWSIVSYHVNATASQRGLIIGGQVPGTTTNDNASAGNVGEYLETLTGSTNQTDANGFTVCSRSLTAGDWDVSGTMYVNVNSATIVSGSPSVAQMYLAISGNTGNTFTGETQGQNTVELQIAAAAVASNSRFTLTIPMIRVKCDGTNLYVNGVTYSTTTTLILHGQIGTYSSGTPTFSGRLSARRAR
jgi:hypothetical protein